MTHLSGRCTCGRRQHYPKDAKLGSTWTCWNCGRTWKLSTRGKPLFIQRSKPPYRKPRSPQGCNPAVLAALAGAWLTEIALDLYLTAERILSRG